MSKWWENHPWRLIQTNLREIDMQDIDARQVVADLQDFQATVLMINAAGIIASYPTELPYHFQSPYLQGDSLADIIEACHEVGIRVIARTDFSKMRRPIYEAHPEWAYRTVDGAIVDYNGDIHACINGGYQQEYMLTILEEMFQKLDFDGIFFNMGGYQTRDYSGNYYGICHCANCRARFQEMFNLPLPTQEDLDDPLYRKYVVFKRRTTLEHLTRIYRFIQKLRPDACIAHHGEFEEGFVRQESNTAIARPLPHWQYSASDNTKWVVSSYPQLICSNTTVDFIDFPYRHVAVSPQQQRLRLAQNLANGGALDYYIIGRLDNHEDRSGFGPVKELFHYHAANEDSYRGLRSKANVALINGPYANTAEFRGWFRFLAEHHFLFDTLMTEAALDHSWERYQAIILPDYQTLSDELAARLDRFVAEGGVLIAAGRSGFRDEAYEPRSRPALQSLGIQEVELIRSDMTSSYLKFDQKADFPRFVHTDLLYLDGPYVYAAYAREAKQRLRLIPPHNFGPPERCYYEIITERPGFVVHPYGKGRSIYIPWLPGALFYRQGYMNTSDFVADLLTHVAGLSPVGGNLSPMVEATHFASNTGQFELVHLVNGSGHFGVSFFEPVTMTNLTVTVAYSAPPKSVQSLVTGNQIEHTWSDGKLTLQVPRLDLFEALRIE